MTTTFFKLPHRVVGVFSNYLHKGIVDELIEFLKLGAQNDINLHVKEVRERGDIKINSKEISSSVFDTLNQN